MLPDGRIPTNRTVNPDVPKYLCWNYIKWAVTKSSIGWPGPQSGPCLKSMPIFASLCLRSLVLVTIGPQVHNSEVIWLFLIGKKNNSVIKWGLKGSSGIHVDARVKGFKAELCTAVIWSVLFTPTVSGVNVMADQCKLDVDHMLTSKSPRNI